MRGRRMLPRLLGLVIAIGGMAAVLLPVEGQTPKRGGVLTSIQKQLESDVARPMLGWRKEHFTQWPHVKNLVAHHSLYNWGRMQDVWLDT
jgi:hypothetical protein